MTRLPVGPQLVVGCKKTKYKSPICLVNCYTDQACQPETQLDAEFGIRDLGLAPYSGERPLAWGHLRISLVLVNSSAWRAIPAFCVQRAGAAGSASPRGGPRPGARLGGLVKSWSKAGPSWAAPWPWGSEKAPSPWTQSLCAVGVGQTVSGVHWTPSGNWVTPPTREQNQDKVTGDRGLPLAPRLGAEEKLRSLLVGPSLPVVTVSVTTLACSLPSQGRAVLTFPPRCPFGPLVSCARSPPRCSLCGGQPNSQGRSCHCGPEPSPCLLPGQSQGSGSLPGPQLGPRSPGRLGKLAKSPRSPAWQSRALCPRHLTPGLWPASGQTHGVGLSALLLALWVTLACPQLLWAPSLRP